MYGLKIKTAASAPIANASFITESLENIVVSRVPPLRGGVTMTPEQFDREKKYQAALAVARSMLQQGIINDDDFNKTETILRRKFSPFMGSYSQDNS